MVPPDTEAARLHARSLGREAGAKRGRAGGDCPYRHDTILLRLAWFDGFSQGRATLAAPAVGGAAAVAPPAAATGAVFPTGKPWHSS